uniref:Uncharacterized protein n=1 Tax=viral metagenome TaxID=1070528 RepID=A0A6H2A6N5_9ZZZZ
MRLILSIPKKYYKLQNNVNLLKKKKDYDLHIDITIIYFIFYICDDKEEVDKMIKRKRGENNGEYNISYY